MEQLNHPGGATALKFDPDGMHLFSAGYDGTIREWDLARRSQIRVLSAKGATIWTLDLSPDGKRIAAGGEDAIIRIWNLDSPSAAAELRGHTRNIWEVRFSPDGKRLASCSFDYSVRLWDAIKPRLLKTLSGHKQSCVGLDYSPDGTLLASGGDRFDDSLLARFGRRAAANGRQRPPCRQGRVQWRRPLARKRRASARDGRRIVA